MHKNNKNNKKEFKFILLSYLVWFIFIFLFSLVSLKSLPGRKNFSYSGETKFKILLPRANFDGSHYLYIAENGYGLHQQAFFPLYPTLIKKFSLFLGIDPLFSGFLISNISFLVALFVFYKLVIMDYDSRVGYSTLLFLLMFPTSFFFGSIYTESLFLFLTLLSFYFARKKKWLFSGIFGGLASATRLVGIFIFPALIIEWWEQQNFPGKEENNFVQKFFSLICLFLIPLGLGFYMNFLKETTNDPFLFFKVQKYFGAERGERIILLYQVFWRYLKMIAGTKMDVLYLVVWQEFLTAIFFILLIVLSYKEKIRKSYLVFSLLCFITPTLTGTFSSLPRYVLVMFPCFIMLGKIKNEVFKKLIFVIFFLFLSLNAILFFNGYWVA